MKIKNEQMNNVQVKEGDDDDKIIFNFRKHQIINHLKEFLRTYEESKTYTWALAEGYKPESNGDIIIDNSFVLSKRF